MRAVTTRIPCLTIDSYTLLYMYRYEVGNNSYSMFNHWFLHTVVYVQIWGR